MNAFYLEFQKRSGNDRWHAVICHMHFLRTKEPTPTRSSRGRREIPADLLEEGAFAGALLPSNEQGRGASRKSREAGRIDVKDQIEDMV